MNMEGKEITVEEFPIRRIEASSELRDKIAKTFGVSNKTVYNALTYDKRKGGTETARRIRRMALINGAVKMVTLPEDKLLDYARGLSGM